MKKLLSIALTIILVLSLTSCGNKEKPAEEDTTPSETESQEEVAEGEEVEEEFGPKETGLPVIPVTEDTKLMALQLTPPEGYETVERYVEFTSDNKLSEKNLTFTMEDGTFFSYAYSKDTYLSDILDTESLDTSSSSEETVYLYDRGASHMAFVQKDDDLYGINYETPEKSDSREPLEEAIAGLSFGEATEETAVNNLDFYRISYELDNTLPLDSYTLSLTEDKEGKEIRKSILFRFGDDPDNLLFRFLIRVYRDTNIEDVLDPEIEYEDVIIGTLVYTAESPILGEDHYAYYIQYGSDVYLIKNNGANNGFATVRSKDSEKHFREFLRTIRFN